MLNAFAITYLTNLPIIVEECIEKVLFPDILTIMNRTKIRKHAKNVGNNVSD
jgi:hypothetical protein